MESEQLVQKYTQQFLSLKRATSHGLGKAPHKPILLLAVMQLIHKGEIVSNHIEISGSLLIAFKDNWNRLVNTAHTPNFSLPFFHLGSEPFWHLVFNGRFDHSEKISSLGKLKNRVAFAQIDPELFLLLLNPLSRGKFENLLLDVYFPTTGKNYDFAAIKPYPTQERIASEILNDTKAQYQTLMQQLATLLSDNELEEERFIRGSIFKKEIPRIYQNRCCISGMYIQSVTNAQMIDACHIVPFSASNDDTVGNGISLAPNLHRAFDRGLITITDDYKVKVSGLVKENDTVFSLGQFAGQKILLPEKVKDYPLPDNFQWHGKECFLG